MSHRLFVLTSIINKTPFPKSSNTLLISGIHSFLFLLFFVLCVISFSSSYFFSSTKPIPSVSLSKSILWEQIIFLSKDEKTSSSIAVKPNLIAFFIDAVVFSGSVLCKPLWAIKRGWGCLYIRLPETGLQKNKCFIKSPIKTINIIEAIMARAGKSIF